MTAPALALAMVGCCATGRRRCARPHSVAASPSPHSLGAQQEGRCSLPGLTGVVAAPPSSDPATAAISILAPSFFQCRVDGCHGEDADGGRGCGLQFKARASGTELAPTFRCELQLPKGEHVSSMAVITKLPRVGVAYKHESKQKTAGVASYTPLMMLCSSVLQELHTYQIPIVHSSIVVLTLPRPCLSRQWAHLFSACATRGDL
ncbi:hypothetical protein ACQJBY_058882 [Aegilops geniculata]